MHYVLYRHTQAYGANMASGFLKFFMPRISETRPVLAPMLAADPCAEGVREFDSPKAAADFLESLSEVVMTPRSEGEEDPFTGWVAMAVEDDGDRRARLEAAGLEEV